jgi:hypothetical protein
MRSIRKFELEGTLSPLPQFGSNAAASCRARGSQAKAKKDRAGPGTFGGIWSQPLDTDQIRTNNISISG